MTSLFVCPVCGFIGLPEPARGKDGHGLFEYCPCCLFQFGVTDEDQGWTDAAWRDQWIADAMPWRSKYITPPTDWDPQTQLATLLGT